MSAAVSSAEKHSALIYSKNADGLFERVRGQTADLDWTLRDDRGEAFTDFAQARQFGQRAGVSVVIWFEISGKYALTVNAVEVSTGKSFRRKVEPATDGTRLSASATSEAAALVVRSFLVAMAEGESAEQRKPTETKTARPTQTRSVTPNTSASAPSSATQSTPAVSTKSTPPTTAVAARTASAPTASETHEVETAQARSNRAETAASDTSRPAPATEPRSRVAPITFASGRWTAAYEIAAGWQAAIDGASPYGQQGPVFRLGLRVDRLQLAFIGLFTLPAEVTKPELSLRLRRYQLLASVGYELVSEPKVQIVTAVSGGMVMYTRSTTVFSDNLRKMPDASPKSMIIQGEGRFQWFPAFANRVVGLEWSVALAIIPAAPSFGVKENERIANTSKLWLVQPSSWVGLVIHAG